MSKGTYNVQNRRRQSIDDTSWKSCTCALLIFFTICILILLLSWNWRHPQEHKEFDSKSERLNKDDDIENFEVNGKDHDLVTKKKLEKIEMERHPSTTEELDEEKLATHTEDSFTEKAISVDYSDSKHSTGSETRYTLIPFWPGFNTFKEASLSTEEYIPSTVEPDSIEVPVFEDTSEKEMPKFTTDEKIMYKSYDTTEADSKHTTDDTKITNAFKIVHGHRTTYDYKTSDDLGTTDGYSTTDDYSTTNDYSTTDDSEATTDSTYKRSTESSILHPSDEKVTRTKVTDDDGELARKRHLVAEAVAVSVTRKMIAGVPLTTPMTIEKYSKIRTYSMPYLKDTCDSAICKVESSNILSLIDHDANPCDGFYEYACHGMLDPHVAETNMEDDVWRRIEGKVNEITSDSPEYLKKFKSYYTTCVNHNPGVDPNIKEKFREHLSLLSKFKDHTVSTMLPTCKIITDLIKRNFIVFFDLKLEVDKNSGKMGLAIMPTTYNAILKTFMGDNSYVEKCWLNSKTNANPVNLNDVYDKYKICENNLDSYMEMARAALVFADTFSDSVNQTHDMEETLNILKHIMLTIQKFAPHPFQVKTATEINSQYITIKELKELSATFLDFEFAFQSIMGSILNDDDKIRVYFLENFKNMMTNIPFDKLRVVNNGILALYAQSTYRDFVLARNRPFDRHKICLKAATDLMVDATSYMYLSSFNDKEIESANKLVSDIYEKIYETLEADLKHADVLADPSDKTKAVKAIKNIYFYALDKNRPWNDEKFLLNRFSTVDLTGELMYDTTHLQEHNRNLMYEQYLNDPKLAEIIWTYIKPPYDTKISSIKNLNTILIPMGAIRHINERPEMPKCLIMADLGFKLAKEMFIYLESKNIKVFTSDRESKSKNISITDFLNNQFVEFQLDTSNLFSNNIIPDLAAARLIYTTYQRHFDEKISNDFPVLWLEKSWEELYFIRLSQNFCTKRKFSESWIDMFEENEVQPLISINTMAVNLQDFLSAFKCKTKIMQGTFDLTTPSEYDRTD